MNEWNDATMASIEVAWIIRVEFFIRNKIKVVRLNSYMPRLAAGGVVLN